MADTSQAAPSYFQALLDRGIKRKVQDEPQLQLGLQDISRKVRNLGQGGPTQAKAHYLLSASGVNTGKSLRDLEDLIGGPASESIAVPTQAGVRETLAQTHQSDFQKMVESHIKRAHDDFDKLIEERLHGVDWDAQRQRIYQHFGLKKPQNLDSAPDNASLSGGASFGRSSRRGGTNGPSVGSRSTFGIPGMTKSIIGTPGPRGARTSVFGDVADKISTDGFRTAPESGLQRRKQEKYAEKIKDLNVARLQEKVYPVLARFAEVEAEPSPEDTSMLVHAYKALAQMTGEDAEKENLSDPGVVRERQYARDYLDDNANARGQVAVRKRIINGSRVFLEKQFLANLEATVSKNPKEANAGGIPTALAQVKGYVRVRAARKELGPDVEILQELNGDYCWPVVFYLLRSGLYREALEYVNDSGPAFRQIDRQFLRYLKAFVEDEDHRLPPDLQTNINNEYSQRMRLAPEDSLDPYRMLCYKVVGRCDLARRNLDRVTSDMMDWMWLQFALAREYNRVDDFAHEALGLEEIRTSTREVGERFFGPGSEIANAPTTLFFMQILAGMFEKAIADLYAHNYVSAVHFAIALAFYGLVRVSDISNSDDLLSYTTRQQPQIAFGSMVGLYTRDFRTANATAAVDYITLLCLNGDLTAELGRAQRELCHQALKEVVLETREFAQLLGDVRADGQRIKGAIEQRLKLVGFENEKEYLKHITLEAGRIAEEQSRTTDATLLYHLAEDYNKVYHVVNEALSLSLTTELGEKAARLTPLRPRSLGEHEAQGTSQIESSLSLSAIEDPAELAEGIRRLYNSNNMYLSRIEVRSRDTCNTLLQLAVARKRLEAAQWADAVDAIGVSQVLPMDAAGNMSAIRSKAQAFEQMPPVISRTIGSVMVWAVIGCTNQVGHLRKQHFDTGAMQGAIGSCVQTARDVMVFAGLIRYKLPGRIWETLARAGQDLGTV